MQRIVYVDIDDTLVRSVGSKRIPMPAVVAQVKRLHAEGAILYLWSSGGADYCRQTAMELGLGDLFAGFLPKPTGYIDDQPMAEWRFCRHFYPAQAENA
ncbi:DUF705 domain-containing protein [Chitinimonas sp.]|uniref:DUF705 domain-containing protein n=1 Tax=Chitinimonas sp. TaxID=1934313 RepID=UPI0035B380AB